MTRTVTCDLCKNVGGRRYALNRPQRVDYGDGRPKNNRYVYIGSLDICDDCLKSEVRLRKSKGAA